MVRSVRAMEAALGDGKKELTSTEKKTVIIQRRGMFATRDIPKGEKFTRDAIVLLRPATGLRPPMLPKVVGKKAKRAIKTGQAITKADV
jgi:N,N'-diacetyllegionaminate synthase